MPRNHHGSVVFRVTLKSVFSAIFLLFSCVMLTPVVHAEYGDIVLNNYSDEAGIRPVVFPHWFHRIRYTCKACHSNLGFKFKAGGSDINMLKIINGEYCGACHNGQIAWAMENCDLCHTALKGTPTQAHLSTKQQLMSPLK